MATFCTFPPRKLSIFETDWRLNSQDFSGSFLHQTLAISLANFCTFPPWKLSIFEVDWRLNSQGFSMSLFGWSPCADDRLLHQCMSESPRGRTLPLQNASLGECAKRLLRRTAYETREKLLKDFTFSRGASFDLQTFSRPKESTTFRKESRWQKPRPIFGDFVPFSASLSTSRDV